MPELTPIPKTPSREAHAEAVALFESHRNLFEHYARGAITIAPAPADLKTFAFDLEKNTIYMNSMFYKNLGLSDERTVFASFHEIEHFLEKRQILAEKNGEAKFKKYLDKIKKSRAFSLTDNCVADIHVNRTVVSKTNDAVAELEQGIYKEVLFKEKDFTKMPKHIQFPQALLREARVPDEKCVVDPEVRKYLDQVSNMVGKKSGKKFMDVLTDPLTTMSDRLDFQDRVIMPIVEKLKRQDIEEEKQKRKQDKKKKDQENKEQEKKDKEEGEDEGDQQENKDGQEEGEGESQKNEGDPENGEGESQKEEGESGNEEGEDEQKDGGGESDEKSGEDDPGEFEFDPNDFWKEQYDEADKNTPNAVPIEKIEEAMKEFAKAMKDEEKKEKNETDRSDQEYAESIGVTKNELQNYRQYLEQIEKIVNPETGVTAIEEIRELISRIISKRKKKRIHPKYPTEEGELLVEPATLITEVRSGNLQPKVWETTEFRESPSNKFGEIEITLVADRSGSMDEGEKRVEQLKAAVLMMEALKEFADICKDENTNVTKPLEVRSEIYSFQSNSDDSRPVKEMSAELSEHDRIKTAAKLAVINNGSSTTDFVTLEAIYNKLDKDSKEKISKGELKKIVIVFTDGGSDDVSAVMDNLEKLRDAGVVVIGIGVTESGKPALTTYAPNAILAETASKLPLVLADVLKDHIGDL